MTCVILLSTHQSLDPLQSKLLAVTVTTITFMMVIRTTDRYEPRIPTARPSTTPIAGDHLPPLDPQIP